LISNQLGLEGIGGSTIGRCRHETARKKNNGSLPRLSNLGLEGIVSKHLTSAYRSGPSKTWIKVKNPKAPAATHVLEGTF